MEMDPSMEYSFVPIDGSIDGASITFISIRNGPINDGAIPIDYIKSMIHSYLKWMGLYDGSIDRAKQIGLYKPIWMGLYEFDFNILKNMYSKNRRNK